MINIIMYIHCSKMINLFSYCPDIKGFSFFIFLSFIQLFISDLKLIFCQNQNIVFKLQHVTNLW